MRIVDSSMPIWSREDAVEEVHRIRRIIPWTAQVESRFDGAFGMLSRLPAEYFKHMDTGRKGVHAIHDTASPLHGMVYICFARYFRSVPAEPGASGVPVHNAFKSFMFVARGGGRVEVSQNIRPAGIIWLDSPKSIGKIERVTTWFFEDDAMLLPEL